MSNTPRSILIAPDKFKGSLDATAVAESIARGLRRSLPTATLYELPIADGGEGTVDMALRCGFRAIEVPVRGPLGQRVNATFAMRDGTAVLEMSAAAGLGMIAEPTPASAVESSTYGVGELLRAALDAGATTVVVGVGGSSSTDGGSGALQALGATITDRNGETIPPGGEGLLAAERLDLSRLDGRTTSQAEVVVACDVDAILHGPGGAAEVFSRQKGADTKTVRQLERSLIRWADLVRDTTGRDVRRLPGVGAAGGLAFGLVSVLGAQLAAGIDVLLDISGFDELASMCELVVVGEGSLDEQSLMGKGPIGVARRAQALGVPSLAVVGRSTISTEQAARAGLTQVIAVSEQVGIQRSMTHPAESIEQAIVDVLG